MALRIKILQIFSVFILITKYETFTEARLGSPKMKLVFKGVRPDNYNSYCAEEDAWITCDLDNLNETDSDNATQIRIESVLNWAGFNLTKLSIEHTIIRDIPFTVCRMKQLEGLTLNFNRLSNLRPTDCFTGMNQLIYMRLYFNQISDLPDGIFNNPQLQYLDLTFNFIRVLRIGIFDKLPNLRFLYLNNNEISDPTGILANLPELIYLDLSSNQIVQLPDRAFRYFRQLLTLNLSFNRLEDLQPGSFSGLEQLVYLFLNNNRISVLRNGTFDNLTKLQTMYLKNNKISDPVGICANIPELVNLEISGNNISNLPVNCFTQSQTAWLILDLSDNCLSILSLDLYGPMKFISLNISHNALTNISLGKFNVSDRSLFYTRFPHILQWIDFSYNQISFVDRWLNVIVQMCYGVCTIDLSHNRIQDLWFLGDISFNDFHHNSNNPYMYTLNLKGNYISHISNVINVSQFMNPVDVWGVAEKKYRHTIFVMSIDSLICDCQDFTVKQLCNGHHELYNKNHDFILDLTQVICSTQTNHRNAISFPTISIDDMVCDIIDDCPSNCTCFERPSTNSTIINCTDAGLKDSPTTLPLLNRLAGFKYHLILSKNHINRLNYKDYINKTTLLDISDSGVEEIDPRMWRAIQTMKNVSLRNNLLTEFPEIPHGSFTGIQLDIQNNPISCDCKNKWLKSWLESLGNKILNPRGLNCNTPEWLKGKSVILLQEEDFCSSPPYTMKDYLLVTIPTIGGVILLSAIVFLLLRTFRFKIFKYTKKHLFDKDECEGEDMDYDVFLSRSSIDEVFAEELIALLEREGYKVCYPDRDFMPGSIINDNIVDSINKCKRVLCLVTRDFVQSNYCMEEFRISRDRDLRMGKKRTILLLKDPVQQFRDDEHVPNELRDYIRRHTCIEKENIDWENQIMYAMPEHRMVNVDEARFEGNEDLADGEPAFEILLPDGDDRVDRRRLLNFELR